MRRTGWLRGIRRAFARARLLRDGLSHSEIDQRAAAGITRRAALVAGLSVLGTAAACSSRAEVAPEATDDPSAYPASPTVRPRVAVVGAGIAGLHAALRLAEENFDVVLFESSDRVGGRMWTAPSDVLGGRVAELGGELINSDHLVLRALARETGEELDDRVCAARAETAMRSEIFRLGFDTFDEAQLAEWFLPHLEAFEDAVADEAAWNRTQSLSIDAFLHELFELDPRLDGLLRVAYTAEMGLDSHEQSALNLVDLLLAPFYEDEEDDEEDDADDASDDDACAVGAGDAPHEDHPAFHVLGDSDERFHVRRGNDAIPRTIAQRIDGRVEIALGRRLQRVRGLADGGVALDVTVEGREETHAFDRAVVAIPLGTLRDVEFELDLGDAADAIRELGFGTNSKRMTLYREAIWRTRHGAVGSVVSDGSLQMVWDTTFSSPDYAAQGATAVWTNFAGGSRGVAMAEENATAAWTAQLDDLESLFPGVRDAWTGDVVTFTWPTHPHQKGSYACFKPGQYRWYGVFLPPRGPVRFAGEHTSAWYFGYMEGAAESGLRVAAELVEEFGGSGAALVRRVLGDDEAWTAWQQQRGHTGFALWDML